MIMLITYVYIILIWIFGVVHGGQKNKLHLLELSVLGLKYIAVL